MENEALHKGTAVFSLDLHPAYSDRPKEGVHLQLQSRLMRWDDELDGVLLSYSNLHKLPSQVDIRPYFAYLKLKVKADVLIFKPKVGQMLCGQVNKMGADYIGMTIFGAINAAVGRQNIKKDLQYDHQAGIWRCPDESSGDIQEGSDVLFAVDRLRIERNGVLAVMGSLKEDWSGSVKLAAMKAPNAFSNPEKWKLGASHDFTFPIVQNKEKVDDLPQRQASASILEPLTAKKEEKKRKRDANSAPDNPPGMGTNEEKTVVGKLEKSLDAVYEPSGKKKKRKEENTDELLASGPTSKNQEKGKFEKMPDEESLRRKEVNSIQNGFTFTPDQKTAKDPSTNLVSDSGKKDSLTADKNGETDDTQVSLPAREQEKKVKKKKKVKQKENTPVQTDSRKEEGSPINGTPDVSIGDEIDTESKKPSFKKIGEENSISKKDKKKKKKSKDKTNLQT